MKIVVFGLGYVGCVSAACLAELGHTVVGVDVNPEKVAQINAGHAPILEPGLPARIQEAVASGGLSATISAPEAMQGADVAFICVGTPSADSGALDYTHLQHVADELSTCIHAASPMVVIAVRSTAMSDVVSNEVLPRLTRGGARPGVDFGICINPEFLREGSAVRDFHHPPFTLIGQMDDASGRRLAEVYRNISAPIIQVDLATAGLVKYASNAFHAMKVAFANEMGVLCEHLGADSHAVMDVFCEDTKLNISRAYLKPGFAFGGSCLPKDLRAIQHRARHADEDLPVLQSILRSNDLHIKRAADVVRRSGSRQIGMVGLSFKPETDDLRESPLVSLIELLIGRGLDVRVFDPEVALSRVMGGNRAFIDRTIPHITNLMCESLDDLVASTELVIVGKPTPGLNEVFDHVHRDGQVILDLARHWGRSIEHVAGRPIVRLC